MDTIKPRPTISLSDLEDDVLYTVEQSAEILKKSPWTLHRWHALRMGPARSYVGRTPYHTGRALRRHILAQEKAEVCAAS